MPGIRGLAEDIGLTKLSLVGNKIRSEKDEAFLRQEMAGFHFLGFIPFTEDIIEADLEGLPPFKKDLAGLKAVKEMIKEL